MPEGIVATVDDGFATLDFVDTSLRGPALTKLLDIGGPATIETLTRVGPRRQYRVPEGNAREAGLIDDTAGPAARGLASIEDQPQGELVDGVRGAPTPGNAGIDSGAAAALAAANPNTNAGADNADWHTPTAEYTSENKYVGTSSAAAERALAPPPQQYPGVVGTGYGGSNAGETPTHREVIDRIKAYAEANPKGEPRGEAAPHGAAEVGNVPHSVQALNLGLADQESARGDDPGSRPDVGGAARGDFTSVQSTRQYPSTPTATGGAEGSGEQITPPDNEDVVEYPEGAPSSDWRRDELDAYALKVKSLDTTSLQNKTAVLNAIKKAKTP